ncbi:hypothetical protein HCUR_01434 [Holospora curviuscula]|uniref:Uncharacterized protein n=1 Tax=Holospora curviuscula TaxID=1082868 RepID=A0A2S5R7F5_9PROT|nr:hypothetical protein HCUR_01434 [Holospora curviuscula]
MSLPLNSDVHSARTHDSTCAKRVLFGLKKQFLRLVSILAHQGYLHQWVCFHTQGVFLSMVHMENILRGLKSRNGGLVERSFPWLDHFRRLSKNYERSTASAKTFIPLSFTKIILNKLEQWFT